MPTDGQGLELGQSTLDAICFQTFDPTLIITDTTMLDRYNFDEAVRQVDATAEAIRQAEFESEVTGTSDNDLCTASLTEISDRIDAKVADLQAQLDATTNAAEVKAHLRNQLYPALGTVFKRIAKCVRSRAR